MKSIIRLLILSVILFSIKGFTSEKMISISLGTSAETASALGIGIQYGKYQCIVFGISSLKLFPLSLKYYGVTHDISASLTYTLYYLKKNEEIKGSTFWSFGLGYRNFGNYRGEQSGCVMTVLFGWRAFLDKKKTIAITFGIGTSGFAGMNLSNHNSLSLDAYLPSLFGSIRF